MKCHSLSALIQMMAAAEAKRDMCYFTFNDYGLRDEVYKMHKFIRDKELACCEYDYKRTTYFCVILPKLIKCHSFNF